MAPRIIGIAGQKRVGKNTLCNFLTELHPYQQTAFAQALWNVLLAADPLIPDVKGNVYRLGWLNEKFGYEYCKTEFPEVRSLLQRLGTEGVRKYVGETTWLDLVERNLVSHPETSFIVSDVRFPNESEMIRRLGGIVVKLERKGFYEDKHASESYINQLPYDVLIENNGDLNDLQRSAQSLLEL